MSKKSKAKSSVLMQLGPIRFSITGPAYTELDRKSEFRWPTMERLGRRVAHQYVGPGEDTISLKGTIYPGYNPYGGDDVVGIGRVDMIRVLAELGIPFPLITGYGGYYGLWVIKSVQDTGSFFFSDGSPRKQEFTIELCRYGEDVGGILGIVFSGGLFHVPRIQDITNFAKMGFGGLFGG